MSLQPNDPATDAFERLRSEVALLRRAVEGLAAENGAELIDYSPTLSELSEAIAETNAQLTALGERPALALAPEQVVSLLQLAAARVLAKPVAELERERTALAQATEALRALSHADGARSRSWRRTATFAGAGAVVGAMLWSLLLGPISRSLPTSWRAPERLASATLALPMASAGERLLRRGDPVSWEAVQVARLLPDAQMAELRRCLARPSIGKVKTCTLKLREG